MNCSHLWFPMVCVAALASSRTAHADDDVATAARAVCASIDKSKVSDRVALDALGRLCAADVQARMAKLEHQRLPPSFFDAQLCSDVTVLARHTTDAAAITSLQKTCRTPPVRTRALPLDSVLVNVVSGLGDHIAAIARQDLVDYVTANLTGTFCKTASTSLLALGNLFPNTCRLFHQTETPIDSLTLSGVKAAFLLDAKGMRKTLPVKLEAVAKDYLAKHPPLQTITVIGGLVTVAVYDTFVAKLPPRRVLTSATSWIQQQYPAPSRGAAPNKLCSLVTNPNDPVCIAILGATIVTRIQDAYDKDEDVAAEVPYLIEAAASELCADHTFPSKADTSCVIDPKYHERWHDKVLRLYDALIALHDEEETLLRDPLTTKPVASPKITLAKTSFPQLGADLRELFAAFLALCNDGSTDYHDAESLYLSVIDLALAAAQEDIPGTRTPLLQILDNPIVTAALGKTLDDATKTAVNLVTSLAAAKDATEAKAVIDAIAAPAGTYKEKYGRSKLYVAIGSVIGPTVLWQDQFSRGPTTSAFVTRFSAPVGVELMPPSLSRKWFNVGIAATLIDPLAMAASDWKGNTPDSNIGAVLDFGGYVRLGILKSPISVVAGASWRPGLHTPSDCTSGCYDRTFELFTGIVADVPLLVLH